MHVTSAFTLLILLSAFSVGNAVAALHGRLPVTPGGTDYQAYYDDDLNVTWVADGRLAATMTFGLPVDELLGPHPDDSAGAASNGRIRSTGQMNWAAALHWIDAMNAAGYLGSASWRLPAVTQPDASCSIQEDAWLGQLGYLLGLGSGCVGSEMGHLFTVEGIRAYAPGPFRNLISYYYWYKDEFDPSPEASAWDFHTGTGSQYFRGKLQYNYVLPVMTGDIAAPSEPDIDQDGFPDAAELSGLDVDGDGVIDLDLPALGADPCRKTIVVEVDYMDGSISGLTHAPHPQVLETLADSFARAPVPVVEDCPYPGFPASGGVNFVGYVDQEIPEQDGRFALSDLVQVRETYFDERLLPFVHYAVYAHALDTGNGTSGVCCRAGSFIVSLGLWRLDHADPTVSQDVAFFDPAGNQAQRLVIEAGTFMHELGHALGLGHGGDNNIQYKPNYLSIMNYTFQTRGILQADDPARINIDYSRRLLPALDELALEESVPLCADPDCVPLITSWLRDGANESGDITGPIDWNADNVIYAGTYASDINRGDAARCVGDGPDDQINTTPGGDDFFSGDAIRAGANTICETTAFADSDDSQVAPVGSRPDVLHTGHDDWSAIRFMAAENRYGNGISAYEVVVEDSELDWEEARELGVFWDRVRAQLLDEQDGQDGQPPSLSGPPRVQLEGNDPRGWSGDLAAAAQVIADDPEGGPVSLLSDAPSPIPLGETVVNWTATNASGQVAHLQQGIEVVDTTPPSLHAPADRVVTAAGPLTQVDLGEATADDLYGVTVISNDAPASFPIGETEVTWRVQDSNGNEATAVQRVSVRYGFGGFVKPFKVGGIYLRGKTLPVKFVLTYADGSVVADATPTFAVYVLAASEIVGEALPTESSSAADTGSQFRWADNVYIHNLRTDFAEQGSYLLLIQPGDGSEIRAPFGLK